MSGAGIDRWRLPRSQSNLGGRQQRGPTAREKTPVNTPYQPSPNAGIQGPPPAMTNAWPAAERVSRGTSSPSGPAEDQHVPVRGFNAQETRNMLRKDKGSSDVLGPEDKNGVYRAPDGEPPNTKTGGPWASKPNYMANGLDFFVQLRKGITTLQHSANTPSI